MKRWLADKLKDEPGLALTLGYVALTLIGLTYQWALFAKFRVNVLDWAEFSDFVFACLREPTVPLLCLPAYGVLWLCQRWEERLEKKEWYVRWFLGNLWQRKLNDVVRLMLAPMYFFTFAQLYALGIGRRIHQGQGRRVILEYNSNVPGGSAITATSVRPIWIGSTSRAIFLYDDQKKETLIVPQGSIGRIRVEESAAKTGDPEPQR